MSRSLNTRRHVARALRLMMLLMGASLYISGCDDQEGPQGEEASGAFNGARVGSLGGAGIGSAGGEAGARGGAGGEVLVAGRLRVLSLWLPCGGELG